MITTTKDLLAGLAMLRSALKLRSAAPEPVKDIHLGETVSHILTPSRRVTLLDGAARDARLVVKHAGDLVDVDGNPVDNTNLEPDQPPRGGMVRERRP